jgi:hypothetical protein
MQIQLRESRFGVRPGEMRKAEHATGREEELLKLKFGAVRMTLGSREKRLVGQEDTKRVSERKHTKIS